MNPKNALTRALSNPAGLRFADACRLTEAFGFEQGRTSGSHFIFTHPGIPDLINLQNVKGRTKAYQVRQLLKLIERYNLQLEEGD